MFLGTASPGSFQEGSFSLSCLSGGLRSPGTECSLHLMSKALATPEMPFGMKADPFSLCSDLSNPNQGNLSLFFFNFFSLRERERDGGVETGGERENPK